METPPFSELGLSPELLAAVETLGFERPSPIQAKAIPVALTGRDILGLSHTGSGNKSLKEKLNAAAPAAAGPAATATPVASPMALPSDAPSVVPAASPLSSPVPAQP